MSTDPTQYAVPPRVVAYRPGSWFGVFGEHALVVLPPTEKQRVAALWELVDDGAGFAEVLDALIAGGLRDLPAFALVSELDGTTQVVLRGPATARLETAGEPVELDGARATTWIERSLTGVTSLTLELEEAAAYATARLTSIGGLTRVGRVSIGDAYAAGRPAEESAEESVEESVAGPDERPVSEPDDEHSDEPSQQPWEEPDDGPETWEGLETEAFAAVRDQPEPEPDTEPEGVVLAPPGGDAGADPEVLDDPVFGASVPGSYTDMAGSAPLSSTAPAGSYVDSRPAAGAAVSPPPIVRLTFSHGEVVDVDRPVVVGRAPEARRFAADDEPRLVTVPSPQLEISSTHLEVRPGPGAEAGTAVVTDLGSTNGTVLVQPGSPPLDLPPRQAVALQSGALIDLGDGLTISVSAV